jgi:hypothetical protein
MRAEKQGHTLQPTALVNESWLKLTRGEDRSYQDRDHFINVAASAMRQILLDHSRTRLAGPIHASRNSWQKQDCLRRLADHDLKRFPI